MAYAASAPPPGRCEEALPCRALPTTPTAAGLRGYSSDHFNPHLVLSQDILSSYVKSCVLQVVTLVPALVTTRSTRRGILEEGEWERGRKSGGGSRRWRRRRRRFTWLTRDTYLSQCQPTWPMVVALTQTRSLREREREAVRLRWRVLVLWPRVRLCLHFWFDVVSVCVHAHAHACVCLWPPGGWGVDCEATPSTGWGEELLRWRWWWWWWLQRASVVAAAALTILLHEESLGGVEAPQLLTDWAHGGRLWVRSFTPLWLITALLQAQ